MGNSYIAKQREPFAEELKNPNTRLQVAAMMLSEDAMMPLPVVESLMNRCAYSRKTLVQMLYSRFYGPINRGKLPYFVEVIKENTQLRAKMNHAIDEALAGSNIIAGFTDQGLPSDPNGKWPGGMRLHGEVFNDWGGGPGGHEGAKTWRLAFMQGASEAADPPSKSTA